MPRNWQALVNEMSPVMKLVHLAMRQDSFDEDQRRTELLRLRRRFYEDELTLQAARVGCKGRRGQLTNGVILSELNEMSRLDAASIANTFNYDLAASIVRIRSEAPRANRFVYASRLRQWDGKRNKWKSPQITLNTERTARAKAQQDFYEYNGRFGSAVLRPRTAVCPICQGWINRGEVPLRVAQIRRHIIQTAHISLLHCRTSGLKKSVPIYGWVRDGT
jgi:hypothetical protein